MLIEANIISDSEMLLAGYILFFLCLQSQRPGRPPSNVTEIRGRGRGSGQRGRGGGAVRARRGMGANVTRAALSREEEGRVEALQSDRRELTKVCVSKIILLYSYQARMISTIPIQHKHNTKCIDTAALCFTCSSSCTLVCSLMCYHSVK